MIVLTLITISLGNIWILLGENCCWSLLGLKGLIVAMCSLLAEVSLDVRDL